MSGNFFEETDLKKPGVINGNGTLYIAEPTGIVKISKKEYADLIGEAEKVKVIARMIESRAYINEKLLANIIGCRVPEDKCVESVEE